MLRKLRRAGVTFGLWCVLAGHGFAQAPRLDVVRDPGAESCPDAAVRAAVIARLGGSEATADAAEGGADYRVEFSREPAGFRASIRAESAAAGERVLRARGPSCSALAQASAVALALLFDPEARTPEPAPAPQPAAANAPGPDEPLPPRKPQDWGLSLALGPAASFGVIGPFAPALSGELGLRTARWRAGLGAQWLLPQRRALAPGSVRETLVTAAVRGCYAAWRGPADLRLELCSGLWLGSLSARADGFTRDASASELWLAWPIELTLAQSTGPIGWELIATAILPVRRRDFAIEGAGSAYRSAPIAALLCLRAVGLWPSSDSFGRGQ